MYTKQISIFVENRQGRVYEIVKMLADANINLYGLTIADTTEFGIMRCLTDKPDDAVELLLQKGVIAKTNETIVIEVPDRPGGLAEVLGIFHAGGINIEYLYSFVHTKNGAGNILLKASEPERALDVLSAHQIKIVCGDELHDNFPG